MITFLLGLVPVATAVVAAAATHKYARDGRTRDATLEALKDMSVALRRLQRGIKDRRRVTGTAEERGQDRHNLAKLGTLVGDVNEAFEHAAADMPYDIAFIVESALDTAEDHLHDHCAEYEEFGNWPEWSNSKHTVEVLDKLGGLVEHAHLQVRTRRDDILAADFFRLGELVRKGRAIPSAVLPEALRVRIPGSPRPPAADSQEMAAAPARDS